MAVPLEPDAGKSRYREPVAPDFFPAASLGLHQLPGLADFFFLSICTTHAQTLHAIQQTSVLITLSLPFPDNRTHTHKLIPRHRFSPCISLFADVFMTIGSSPDSSEAFKVFMVL